MRPESEASGIIVGHGHRFNALRADIANGGFFVACFSHAFVARCTNYMHDELVHDDYILHERGSGPAWFIPFMLDDSPIPKTDLGFVAQGGGRRGGPAASRLTGRPA